MAKAGKKLKRRVLSVQHVHDVHFDNDRVYLNIKCIEGWLTLALSSGDLRYIAGFSARQFSRQSIDARAKGSHVRAVE